ncbi:hypothetical protein OQA88_10383 [Cercophora sp. LCS_1]
MDKDIIQYARDAAAKGDDLFALLSIDATASESDIRRAFRRKALTAHPDKAGDAYDPALYERLERARDVLVGEESRKAYDDGMRAILQKKVQLEQMSSRRRKLVEDLEQREQEAKRAKTDAQQAAFQRDTEREAMAARGKAKLEERRRLVREAEERERLAQEKKGRKRSPAPVSSTSKPREKSPETGKPATADGQATVPPPAAATTAPANGDDYDERIAELERRLRENELRRAEKKAKKAKKGGQDSQTTSHPPPPINPKAEADILKQPSDQRAADQAPAAAPRPSGGGHQNPSDRIAATMARLKAAQAKRDEENRRRAEEAAKASADDG